MTLYEIEAPRTKAAGNLRLAGKLFILYSLANPAASSGECACCSVHIPLKPLSIRFFAPLFIIALFSLLLGVYPLQAAGPAMIDVLEDLHPSMDEMPKEKGDGI